MLRSVIGLLFLSVYTIRATEVSRFGDMFGQLYSPDYPATYANNLNKLWNITVPRGFKVELFFQDFDLEFSKDCEYDYVKVSTDEAVLGQFCGGSKIGVDSTPGDVKFTSTGNQMAVVFHSDYSNEHNFYGFSAHYRANDINECDTENGGCDHYCHNYLGGFYCSCRLGYELHADRLSCTVECAGNMLYAREGVISSPDYPLQYPRQLQCDWTISVEAGYVINLNFTDFDVEEHPDVICPYDYLKIESDGNIDGPLCGTEKPRDITTRGHVAKISFHSDGLRGGRGFEVVYTTTAKPCVEISAPLYGSMIGDEFTFKATVIFECQDGYILKGSESRSCKADGSWTGVTTSCQIVECDQPPSIPHGSWRSLSNNFTFTNSVEYECDEFYDLSLESDSVRICTSNGVWSPDQPVCEQICGEASVSPHTRPSEVGGRIVGGRRAVPGSWPWQALLKITRSKFSVSKSMCGGVLINEQWVITAAHCLNDTAQERGRAILPITSLQIFLGTNDITADDSFEVYPEKIIAHPDFDIIAFDADIALVKLNQSVQFSPMVRPVCLPEQSTNVSNDNNDNIDHGDLPSRKGVVIGWGKQASDRGTSNYLREVYVPLVSRQKCRSVYRPLEYPITENMVCAGERRGGKDACEGDSGGPFMFRNYDLAYFAYGLVSWGNGCGKEGYYGVYTRVDKYVNWIRNVTATG
ncbi:mannan-binding lectin serine protease 1-like [Anneissia japonica]|uniref:mannan-binding lectin serine protease 1-like n=1 Tax=Anneissia japonica TaxID=1529436 RepID=UPI001425564E|nr:mannan-binding lectin serine protease 1-like [Anneissia japonica]